MQRHPLCCMCMQDGKVQEAKIADHIQPHRGDPDLFWNGKLQSLCRRHHERVKKVQEKGRMLQVVGLDGWPQPLAGQGQWQDPVAWDKTYWC